MTDTFNTVETQASYGIGFQMGQQLQSNPFDGLAIDAVVAGLKDAFAGQAPQVDNDTLRDAFGEIHKRMQAAKEEASKAVIEEGTKYLEENAKRDEVTVTESGLQYEVLEEGEGASPEATDMVKVHYRGTLLDGTEFDSSYKRGEPAEFPLNRVISGWTEGVQLMKEGAKYRFHIPSELAYGARSTGAITPNSTLIFDVELLEVVKPEAEAPAE